MGFFITPLKHITTWEHEQAWTIYSLSLILIPPAVAFYACKPFEIYMEQNWTTLIFTALGGALWGFGCLLFGVSNDIFGQGLGTAIPLGLCSSLGGLFPLILQHSDRIATPDGLMCFISIFIAGLGTGIIGWAGHKNEAAKPRDVDPAVKGKRQSGSVRVNSATFDIELVDVRSKPSDQATQDSPSFTNKIMIAIFAGIFSACLNVSFAVGQPITDKAEADGISKIFVSTPVFALAVPCGGAVNLIYTLYMMHQKKSFRDYKLNDHMSFNIFASALSGFLWNMGNFLYGAGACLAGEFGLVIGFPIHLGIMLITSNLVGYFYFKEWEFADRKTNILLMLGFATILISVFSGSLTEFF